MSKALFITGTGTDTGKTYITGLITKKLAEAGLHPAYYKAAMSGPQSRRFSDSRRCALCPDHVRHHSATGRYVSLCI